ncbi:MAG: hypothetical protein NTY12_05110 [Candidatus Falkowbacteria bacterium]|nr:hypothetical protein [Candidatus Falkowbacteria bacterium]
MEQLEKFFEDLFLKKITYQLPVKAKEVIVQIAPWVTLVILVISLPAILALFGFGSALSGMGMFGRFGAMYYVSMIALFVQLIMMALSISPLLKREIKGWKLVYYSNLISFVYAILSDYNFGDIIWSLLSLAIGMYIIFQVKSYYK